jgi:hypothetical protein
VDLLLSDSESDDSLRTEGSDEMDPQLKQYLDLQTQIRESLMPSAKIEKFIAANKLFACFTRQKRLKLQKTFELETATFGD